MNFDPVFVETKELRNNSVEVLHRAGLQKQRIILTRKGEPVAALVPLHDLQTLRELSKEDWETKQKSFRRDDGE